MRFIKLNYTDSDTGAALPNMQSRVEFFFHYWTFLFNQRPVSIDPYYLKSHRTIIKKCRLQIEGNYTNAKKRLVFFLLDDETFDKANVVMKRIRKTKQRKAIDKLKGILRKPTSFKNIKQRKFLTLLNTIDTWLENEYSDTISKCLVEILAKNEPLNKVDITNIKRIANYFVIELFNKGYDRKFILELAENMFSEDQFPYEKNLNDFSTKEAFELYKSELWKSLTLENQVDTLQGLLKRPKRKFYLIFRIFDLNFNVAPIEVLNIQFYNPTSNPRINHRYEVHGWEETFTHKPEDHTRSSWCNAYLEIEGIQQDQIIKAAFERVKTALAILNRVLKANGKVKRVHVLHTNKAQDQLWGSSAAIWGELKRIDKVDDIDRLAYFEKLNKKEDKKILNLLTVVYEELNYVSEYTPERLWMILEATFGDEIKVQNAFIDAYKIYLEFNLLPRWKHFFIHTLNPLYNLGHEVNDHVLSKSDLEFLGWTAYSEISSKKEATEFVNKMVTLKTTMPIPIVIHQVEFVKSYFNSRVDFYATVEKWIKYLLTELYAQRNLKVHSNMSDDFFLLKQQELLELIFIVIDVITYQHLKYDKRESIPEIVKKIKGRASRI